MAIFWLGLKFQPSRAKANVSGCFQKNVVSALRLSFISVYARSSNNLQMEQFQTWNNQQRIKQFIFLKRNCLIFPINYFQFPHNVANRAARQRQNAIIRVAAVAPRGWSLPQFETLVHIRILLGGTYNVTNYNIKIKIFSSGIPYCLL